MDLHNGPRLGPVSVPWIRSKDFERNLPLAR